MSHEGWTNYETWVVGLHIHNDAATYNSMMAAAKGCWRIAKPRSALTRSEAARDMLAEDLEEKSELSKPTELSGMWLDLLETAFREIDWHDLADALLTGMDGYEPLKERE